MWRTAGIVRVASVMCAALAFGVGGCGEEDERADGTEAAETQATTEVAQDLGLEVNEDGETVKGKSVLVTGQVDPGQAEVFVNGERVLTDDSGRFRKRAGLPNVGRNAITVKAVKEGFDPVTETIHVTRRRTAAEVAASRERRRKARERRLATLRSEARAIPPREFQKDPDRYSGDPVVMSGQIFQIQEGRGEENFFLMNTECATEFDVTLCDGPTVYVSYDFSTRFTEESLVSVLGVVQGGYEYDTQIGGSNYVGHIRAEIIE